MIPELLPRSPIPILRGAARLGVNGAHVHDLEGILLGEGQVRDQAGVHDDDVLEFADAADVEDHGEGREVGELGVAEGRGEGGEGGVRGLLRGWGWGGVREEEAVFVVAADAGGVEGGGEGDDASGVGAFCDVC